MGPIRPGRSAMCAFTDFKVGYSPERINPGDKVHRLETIQKIVSGMDEETLDCVAKVYELVVEAGVYRAEASRWRRRPRSSRTASAISISPL